MKTIEIQLYEFNELPTEEAKEAARQWWRETSAGDQWWDAAEADARECFTLLGVEPDMGGMHFSGFWNQGDGASFTGSYAYRKGAAKAIRGYAPLDTTLHAIADELTVLQKRNFYRLTAQITQSGRYCHARTMSAEVMKGDDLADDETAEAVLSLMRRLADWYYRQLEKEWEYLDSDAVIDESLIANGYTFTADGKRMDG